MVGLGKQARTSSNPRRVGDAPSVKTPCAKKKEKNTIPPQEESLMSKLTNAQLDKMVFEMPEWQKQLIAGIVLPVLHEKFARAITQEKEKKSKHQSKSVIRKKEV